MGWYSSWEGTATKLQTPSPSHWEVMFDQLSKNSRPFLHLIPRPAKPAIQIVILNSTGDHQRGLEVLTDKGLPRKSVPVVRICSGFWLLVWLSLLESWHKEAYAKWGRGEPRFGNCKAESLEDLQFRTERGNYGATGTRKWLASILDPRKETTQRVPVVAHSLLQPTRLQRQSPQTDWHGLPVPLKSGESYWKTTFPTQDFFSAVHVAVLRTWDIL